MDDPKFYMPSFGTRDTARPLICNLYNFREYLKFLFANIWSNEYLRNIQSKIPASQTNSSPRASYRVGLPCLNDID
jgi:hypothetical protein